MIKHYSNIMNFILTLSMLATLATASPAPAPASALYGCTEGLNYCGHTLLNMGWSRDNIIDDCSGRPDWLTANSVDNVLFHCTSGDYLTFIESCNAPGTCVDAGSGNSDYCS
ncbi:Putative protein of unknown function [Podospora comata]|uniref:Cyanovirin-N domain-containing protein n=1 Tax=Podospora comata TaxID=48703 RepID=A0ABY6RV98_PODCO|nr:Putative protein of unknown function [Podospora comata]